MCGIAGIVGDASQETVERMTDILAYRGPDDSGYYADDGIALGNRRLSVIDTETGRQPIHNEDETIWVTYNGEIYNYQGLRDELRERGHRFYTDTDTEVIVHAYEEWGADCAKRFEGMFAFAVWDADAKTLVLARDRLGKKPLYYTVVDRTLYFGSEVKALLAAESVDPELDRRLLPRFLTMGYVPGDRTLFDGIHRVPPGHHVTVGPDGIRNEEYYRFGIDPRFDGSERAAAKLLRGYLEDAAERWLVSDVPVGAFLSGGIDSAVVVALAAQAADDPLRTFTAGFDTERFDETAAAEQVSDHLGTDHTAFTVEPDAVELLPRLVYHFDDLVADQAAVPNYLLAEQAREDVTVALTGTGGDELFGGYEHYRIMAAGERFLKPVPRAIRRVVPWTLDRVPARLLDRLFPYASDLGEKGMDRFRAYTDHLDDPAQAYVDVNAMMTAGEVSDVLGVDAVTVHERFAECFTGRSLLDGIMTLEVRYQLPDKLLMKADRTSMANSLEVRTPLLNRDTVELMARLPAKHKVSRGADKRVFRRAVKGLVPDEVLDREKQRFFMPIHDWLREDIDWYVEELLHDRQDESSSPLSRDYIDRAINGLETSPLYYARQLWNILSFEAWHTTFIDGESVSRPDNI